MKDLLPVVTAGSAFTGTTLAGLLAGILIAQRTGSQLWVFGGLVAGLALGAYAAARLLMRAQ